MNGWDWKLLAIAAIILGCAQMILHLGDSYSGMEVCTAGIDMAGTVGLVGYAWRLRIARRGVWAALFMVNCLAVAFLVLMAGAALVVVQPDQVSRAIPTLVTLGAMTFYAAVKTYGLFLYAYQAPAVWDRRAPE